MDADCWWGWYLAIWQKERPSHAHTSCSAWILRTGKMLMSAPPTNSHIPARILDLAISYFFAPPKLGYVANERVGCPRQCFREPPHQPTYQRLVGEYRTGLSFSGEFTSFVTFVPGDRGGPTLYFVQ